MSTFTDWNGPQGCGPTKDMWQQLINEYKQLLDSSNYVEKETGKGLSTEDFTTALKNKLDAIKQGTASKDIGSVASGDTGLVTGEAVYNFCNDFVKKVGGKGLSTEDFTTALKNKLDSVKDAATRDVATSTSDGDAKLVTVALINSVLNDYVKKETGKGLSTNDFTDEYAAAMGDLLKFMNDHIIRFSFKGFNAPVGGSDSTGVYYLLGMLDDRAGTAYLRFTDTTSFAAVVNFAVSASTDAYGTVTDYTNGQLSVTTDIDKAGLTDPKFLIVKGTADGKQHVYLAIQASEWLGNFASTDGIGLFGYIPFEGAGINFVPVGSEGYLAPTGATTVLADINYSSLEDRMDAIEAEMGNIEGLDDLCTIRAWPQCDADGVAINVPDGFHACDGSAVDPALTDVIAIIGTKYPLIDYNIIQIKKTVQ